jgi:hypothetical protein
MTSGEPIAALSTSYSAAPIAIASRLRSTLFRPTPDDIKRARDGYLAQGFTAIKFGWGVFGEDRKRDVGWWPPRR